LACRIRLLASRLQFYPELLHPGLDQKEWPAVRFGWDQPYHVEIVPGSLWARRWVRFARTLGDGETFTTIELKIKFHRAVRKATLTAEARVVKAGSTLD
jgi:hypothetical protein